MAGDAPTAAGGDAAAAVEEPAGEETGDADVEIALVEFCLGNVVSRKWTMELGRVYKVGRKDGGADMEIDHPTLSRRHCSLAVTRDADGDLVLVAVDPGSTNGTYVDKVKLERNVGLTKKLRELKHLAFGECQNGYRVLIRGDTSAGSKRAPGAGVVENKRGGPLSEAQKAQIDRLRRLAASGDDPDDDARGRSGSGRGVKRPSGVAASPAAVAAAAATTGGGSSAGAAGGSRRERRAAAAAERAASGGGSAGGAEAAAAAKKRKGAWREGAARVASDGGKPAAPEAAGIEWPEDWR
eukprot:TRINITY_DN131_c0_g2_i1.p1 TRINITY_DN131_c0_g2~~TRINITY_DN131_c0_g2_i1.p1  ORF type:complete len:306 (+),score=88.78 TRINITY_DN131_c0_g2_i1:28-918(+)